MRLRRSTWLVIAISFLTWCAFASRPNSCVQLAAMFSGAIAIVLVAVLLFQAALKWRERGLLNLVSCVLIVVAFPLAAAFGKTIRSAVFTYNLDRWHQAVIWITAHNRPNQVNIIKLPSLYSDLASVVHYTHDKRCGLMIDFFWGGGFPVKHTVRRYAVKPDWMDLKACRTDWSRGRMISGRWYEISD